ncbi:(Fe-S)-binding protein [Novipirellula artificiosorum]|uniref:Lactate utilization protein A n=1 Tax=Novipirellula artificiosorum TaxID=2528016 RepID=A0A5C6DAS3_9BACT|nr:(Fe-S)-binding protein [Novipirellula artificiosorum]TWU33798.1 Lactate utilization protein A [Novipirellula artificiosorum]
MTVALFVPCYLDQFYPEVAIATLELLERLGVDVVFPPEQTCCGQPMANTGCTADCAPVARRFVDIFAPFDSIVCPSGSCTSMVRNHYDDYFAEDDDAFLHVKQRTFDLCEFLYDELQIQELKIEGQDVCFPHRVSLHQSCHGLRELRLGPSSENMTVRDNKVRQLMNLVKDVEWCDLSRPDECCGFGGTFAVNEADVSAAMGRDRVADHVGSGSEVIVSADMSCLMHLQGLIRREKSPIEVMHVAQVLAGRKLKKTNAK